MPLLSFLPRSLVLSRSVSCARCLPPARASPLPLPSARTSLLPLHLAPPPLLPLPPDRTPLHGVSVLSSSRRTAPVHTLSGVAVYVPVCLSCPSATVAGRNSILHCCGPSPALSMPTLGVLTSCPLSLPHVCGHVHMPDWERGAAGGLQVFLPSILLLGAGCGCQRAR